MNRYSAKLLFQFLVTFDGDVGKRRTCEERILVLKATSAQKALATAKRKGKQCQYSIQNSDGNPLDFQFVGVMELLSLDPVCESDEVWYEITERLLPMERADRLIPSEHDLEAIKNNPGSGRRR